MGHPVTVVGFKQIDSCSCWPAISLLGDWLMTRAWGMIECDMSSAGSCAKILGTQMAELLGGVVGFLGEEHSSSQCHGWSPTHVSLSAPLRTKSPELCINTSSSFLDLFLHVAHQRERSLTQVGQGTYPTIGSLWSIPFPTRLSTGAYWRHRKNCSHVALPRAG